MPAALAILDSQELSGLISGHGRNSLDGSISFIIAGTQMQGLRDSLAQEGASRFDECSGCFPNCTSPVIEQPVKELRTI